MNKITSPINYVFNIGILLCLFLIIFAVYILLSNKKELFAQCVYRPKGKRINSLKLDIDISKTKAAYELKLSEFQRLLKLNSVKSRNDFLSKLNDLKQIKESKDNQSQFKIIYEIDNEVLIYRNSSAYGFHLKFLKNPDRIKVMGIVNHYDILSQYINNIPEEYHSIKKVIFGKPDINPTNESIIKRFNSLQSKYPMI